MMLLVSILKLITCETLLRQPVHRYFAQDLQIDHINGQAAQASGTDAIF